MNDSNLFAQRQSCRSFTEQAIDPQDVTEILQAAMLAPSSRNRQPWHFVVVDQPALCRKLARCTQSEGVPINKFADEAKVLIVVVEDRRGIVISEDRDVEHQDFTPLDIGLAVENLCLAATAKGLGSCILGWLHLKEIHDLLAIPQEHQIRLVIALGYPKEQEVRAKQRKAFGDVVSYNKW